MGDFDADAKEAALRAESEAWDTSTPIDAEPGDIPVIDLSRLRLSKDDDTLDEIAFELARACETVGFWQLVGHGITGETIAGAFAALRSFFALDQPVKDSLRMDRPDWPLGGVGYLPMGNRKLPARATDNDNEAFIIKGDRDIKPSDNQWPEEASLGNFRATVVDLASSLEKLTRDLLPIYARALGLERNWFAPAFEHPFWRLRMTRYPGNSGGRSARSLGPNGERQYGINPHVDTTFFTLLLQDSPGLTIYHTPKDRWINVPLVENAFVVNSGELLRQWTNDRFLSVRHFANAQVADAGAASGVDRHSIPFFVNATRDFTMECIPTCCDDGNPPKYPPISYNQSQGVVQGE